MNYKGAKFECGGPIKTVHWSYCFLQAMVVPFHTDSIKRNLFYCGGGGGICQVLPAEWGASLNAMLSVTVCVCVWEREREREREIGEGEWITDIDVAT